MKVEGIPNPEGALLNIFESISPLEWRRFRPRIPNVWINGRFKKIDRSELPPFVAFRFERETQEIMDKIRGALSSYVGEVDWSLVEHKRDPLPGTNWVICPSRTVEAEKKVYEVGMTGAHYLARHEPEFGPIAYEDLNRLTEHFRSFFSDMLK